MEKRIGMYWIFKLKVLLISAVWFSGTLSNAFHLGHISQKRNLKLVSNQPQIVMAQPNPGVQRVLAKSFTTEKSPLQPRKSLAQLQLEIKELLRMQKQLKAEMLSGADNKKKTKLLQHIKTQIHLRGNQIKREQQRQKTRLRIQTKSPKPNKIQLSKQQGNLKIHRGEKTLHNISQIRQEKQNLQINQQQKPPKREQTPLGQPNVQAQIINSPGVHEIIPKQHLKYKTVAVMKNSLKQPESQQYYQVQRMPHPTLMQTKTRKQIHNPIGIIPAHMSLMDQQGVRMNQTILQAGSQEHILVPVNTIALNNMVPRNGERFIVLDAGLPGHAHTATDVHSNANKPAKHTSTQKPSTRPPTAATQKIPTSPTPSTRTTLVTTTPSVPTAPTAPTAPPTPPSASLPSPPTTESHVYNPLPNTEQFRQEFYQGEIQRQKLEITKLKLEIRALRRKEVGGGMAASSSDDDAPPRRQMMRYRMPFRFY